ncbi:PAX3- and PAX7-binding protein 1-like [Ptychodera flava]|uniref:PAX3- and PAX7-binding protein 1-like n=1 Tax=Ptychodera flava TaxID=63121 RepID=UPI003969F5D5
MSGNTMFKKRRNVNLRRREESSDDEDKGDKIPFIDDTPMDTDPPYHTATSLEKMKKKRSDKLNLGTSSTSITSRSSASNLLSFDDDDAAEEDVFQIKKSLHNKKYVKKFKERQQEEKKMVGSKVPTKKKTPESDYVIDNSEQMKGDDEIINGKEMEKILEDNGNLDQEEEEKTPFSNLPSGVIPDAAMIHAARKRRQMAREMGDTFIPLPVDDTQRFESNSSRLIRDDDNDRSDNEEEDEDERISFTVRPEMTQRQKVIEAIEQDSEDSEKEHDEELQRWEQEQIKKGTSVPQIQEKMDEQSSYLYQNYGYGDPQSARGNALGLPPPLMSIDPFNMASNSNSAAGSPSQSFSSVHMPPKDLPSVSLDQVKKQLKDRLESLEQVNRAHQREMDQVVDNLSSSEENTERLKSSFGDMERQYKFFQEMRGYVRDLVECLNAKVPVINSLETQMHNLRKQAANKLVLRRQEDIKDQSEDFTAKGSKAAAAPNLDAHGRTKSNKESNAKQRRQAEREGRRARRKRSRQSVGTDHEHYDGLSSDDEVPDSETARFLAETERITESAANLFEDVIEEFSSFRGIKPHFERWKYHFSETYTEAYISLCLPKLFSPFVRLQLIGWNPLDENAADFEQMEWFETLMYYGFREGEGIERSDPDVKLMPGLVEKVVLPKITYLVENVWDPMSSTQTHRLVEFIHKIADDYPTVSADNKHTQNLLKAIVDRMRKTLDDDVYVPLFPKTLLDNRASGANAFLQRQFWSCVKLLGNILSWNGIVSSGVLQELALDGLLNRYLLLSLQNTDVTDDSIVKCQRIISTFPKQWFSDLKGDSTVRQLENLCRYLRHAVSVIHANAMAASDTEKRKTLSSMKAVIKVLVKIHAMDHALAVAGEYSLRDMQNILKND